MKSLGTSIIRELVQKGVGVVVVWLVAHGVDVPDAVGNWVVLTLVAGGVALWTIVVRFLETRQSRVAKLLARVLMLGIGKTPVYPPTPPESVEHLRNVMGQGGRPAPNIREGY